MASKKFSSFSCWKVQWWLDTMEIIKLAVIVYNLLLCRLVFLQIHFFFKHNYKLVLLSLLPFHKLFSRLSFPLHVQLSAIFNFFQLHLAVRLSVWGTKTIIKIIFLLFYSISYLYSTFATFEHSQTFSFLLTSSTFAPNYSPHLLHLNTPSAITFCYLPSILLLSYFPHFPYSFLLFP